MKKTISTLLLILLITTTIYDTESLNLTETDSSIMLISDNDKDVNIVVKR